MCLIHAITCLAEPLGRTVVNVYHLLCPYKGVWREQQKFDILLSELDYFVTVYVCVCVMDAHSECSRGEDIIECRLYINTADNEASYSI